MSPSLASFIIIVFFMPRYSFLAHGKNPHLKYLSHSSALTGFVEKKELNSILQEL